MAGISIPSLPHARDYLGELTLFGAELAIASWAKNAVLGNQNQPSVPVAPVAAAGVATDMAANTLGKGSPSGQVTMAKPEPVAAPAVDAKPAQRKVSRGMPGPGMGMSGGPTGPSGETSGSF